MTIYRPIDHISYIYDILNRLLPNDIKRSCKNLTMLSSRSGAVFDIPSEYVEMLQENFQKETEKYDYYKLHQPSALPELEQSNYRRNDRSRGGSYGRRDSRYANSDPF